MKTWSDMAATQPLAAKIMTNSFKRGRMSHAYLIQGARGTGKEALALLTAQTLFCTHKSGVDPCGECVDCRRIATGNHPDVHQIVPDGQSIKKDQIDHLQKEFAYSALESSQKVYVIQRADTLTNNAANRILKFLEEPEMETTAFMLTENSQAMLATIRSRCQLIDLKPLDPAAFRKQLVAEGVNEQSARLLSEITNNKTEAEALQEDVWFAEARKLMIQWMEISCTQPKDLYLFVHNRWMPHFKDRQEQERGLDLLLLAYRDILYAHLDKWDGLVVFSPEDERIEQGVMTFTQEKLLRVLQDILAAKRQLQQNVHQTLVMEQLALQIQR
ncbi:DNA-directed DNA polymerase [Lentibacillus sp. JNUCC-1]|uniref:DNA polymerase III subunit delta' n=1 Tax=Lentibacillus sp. JNUCC-1 TaxID=2654513 RepID=UPI0012E83DB9|nr:DNA polymerase III subunit delta' [Lentibacillus sp. JNUCC-1]MUV38002.1 DNA-directed DNA polymerase [Lentibacillus sp. JNUCC-1]